MEKTMNSMLSFIFKKKMGIECKYTHSFAYIKKIKDKM